MQRRALLLSTTLALIAATALPAQAQSHLAHAQFDDEVPTQTVTIVGTACRPERGCLLLERDFIDHGLTFERQFTVGAWSNNNANVMKDVCKSPGATDETKNTSSQSDNDARWLAASQLFTVHSLASFSSITHSVQAIMINGKTVTKGYTVTYSDGGSETWYVMPNWQSSSVKLFDTPVSSSRTPPTKPAGSGC